jgi:hypothetical protein
LQKIIFVFRVFVILVVFTVSASAASILFSYLTEAGLGYCPDGYGLGNRLNTLPPGFYAVAATRFSVSRDSMLQAIQVPVGVWTGANELPAYLFADNLGAPGAAIESFILADVPSLPSADGIPLTTTVSALHPLLKANTSYWFAVYGTPAMNANWQFTTFQGIPTASANFADRILGGMGTEWQVGTGSSGAREGAMVIIGEAVPEPQSGVLIAIGLLVLQMRKFLTLRMCGEDRIGMRSATALPPVPLALPPECREQNAATVKTGTASRVET